MSEIKPIIMVVDDQPDLVEGIKLILEAEDFEVITANNGQAALNDLERAFQQQRGEISEDSHAYVLPDLIVADVMMPIMDGYELYERVRANPYLNHIPFIFLTAKGDSSDIRHGKALGADDYLPKPCPPEDLIASINGKLRRTEQRRSLQALFMDDFGKTPAAGIIVLIAFFGIMVLTIVATALVTLYFAG